MRITIEQSEIEEAIQNFVAGQMTIADNMEMKIDLKATRGETGYTADIIISEKQDTLEIGKKVRAAKKTPTPRAKPAPKAEEPAEEAVQEATESEEAAPAPETNQDENDAPVEAEQAPVEEPVEEAPAAPTNSIFGNLKKPVNAD